MPDSGLLPIALLYGEEADIAHVREALQGQVEIAYSACAREFDVARLGDAHVAAALVNVDGGAWLEAVEASLDAIGVAVVYNDPEISRALEGWDRARWLRHVLAKLRGSADKDPPRPGQAAPTAASRVGAPSEPQGSARRQAAVVERPLSPQEIETMTADFVAVQENAAAPGQPALAEGAAHAANAAAAAEPPPAAGMPAQDEGLAAAIEGELDVDTEALSAMIDARLADAEAREDPTEVWRLVESGNLPDAPAAPAETVAAAMPPAGDPQAAAESGDDDVLASLPSLDDWQLVDPDAAPVAAPVAAREPTRKSKEVEFALSDALAGLELVPMETVSVAQVNTDPVERWLHESEPRKASNEAGDVPKTASHGGKG